MDNTATDLRRERGEVIAKRMRIVSRNPGIYAVPATSNLGTYIVATDRDGNQTCTCPDFETRHVKCKHQWAVELQRTSEVMPDGTTKTTETLRVTYTQESWSAYNTAQTHEKEHVLRMLRSLCDGVENPPQGRGGPRLPRQDRIFALCAKVYGGMSSRRSDHDMRDLTALGLLDKAPSYNSVCDYFDDPELTPVLRELVQQSAAPLASVESDFAIDSSGFSTKTYRRWFDHKWGKERSEARWVKAHIMVGVKTHVVAGAEVTDESVGDSPMLRPLLHDTAKHFTMREVSADKAYSGHANLGAIIAIGATPYVSFKKNAKGDEDQPNFWKRSLALFTLEKASFLAHYHKRSNVESGFSMIKRKFGASVRSKNTTAQINEVFCKIILHNLACCTLAIYELGLAPMFWRDVPAAPAPVAQELAANSDARGFLDLPDVSDWR